MTFVECTLIQFNSSKRIHLITSNKTNEHLYNRLLHWQQIVQKPYICKTVYIYYNPQCWLYKMTGTRTRMFANSLSAINATTAHTRIGVGYTYKQIVRNSAQHIPNENMHWTAHTRHLSCDKQSDIGSLEKTSYHKMLRPSVRERRCCNVEIYRTEMIPECSKWLLFRVIRAELHVTANRVGLIFKQQLYAIKFVRQIFWTEFYQLAPSWSRMYAYKYIHTHAQYTHSTHTVHTHRHSTHTHTHSTHTHAQYTHTYAQYKHAHAQYTHTYGDG